MSHLVLIDGGDQSLYFTPAKRVDSASYEIQDPYYSSGTTNYVIDSGSATIDSYDQLITQESGESTANPDRLYVGSTANITSSFRYAAVHSEHSGTETFSVERVKEDSYIIAEAPLLDNYPANSRVMGIQMAATFPGNRTGADENWVIGNRPLRIVWSYTLDGVSKKVSELIRVVHENESDQDVDAIKLMLEDFWSDRTSRFDDSTSLVNAIKTAKRQVNAMLLSKGIEPQTFLGGLQLRNCIFWKTLYMVALKGDMPSSTMPMDLYLEELRGNFESAFTDLTVGLPGKEVLQLDPYHNNSIEQKNRNPFKRWG